MLAVPTVPSLRYECCGVLTVAQVIDGEWWLRAEEKARSGLIAVR